MSDLPEQDPWSDDDDQDQYVEQPVEEDAEPANWREATDLDSLVKNYDGDKIADGQTASQQGMDEYDARLAQLKAQEERQRELTKVYTRGDERPEYANASSLAEMMRLYGQDGGITSGDYTLVEDANGRLQVYENG